MSTSWNSAGGGGAEEIYAGSNEGLERARKALQDPALKEAERTTALWVVGRAAYYGNRMEEAVRLLSEAEQLVADPGLRAQVLLTLAPALSKQGEPERALALLVDPALETDPADAGWCRNQRGIILAERGRFVEAITEFTDALPLLRAAGDVEREARTMVNLGAATSQAGDLTAAEHWYRQARETATATGQAMVTAMIEGNLGYVESRRGNFASALHWYGKARAGFDNLDDVDLLSAVLDVDHARTLLDVGLAADASLTAERAVESASLGGNQMLEAQAQLLLAESLIRLRDDRGSAPALQRCIELARRLGQEPLLLRARFLATEAGATETGDGGNGAGAVTTVDAESVETEELVKSLLSAGWTREAFEAGLQLAIACRPDDPHRAAELIELVRRRTEGFDIDAVDQAYASLVLADVDDDHAAAAVAFDDAHRALAEQSSLLGSAELRATVIARADPVGRYATRLALRSPTPGLDVLRVSERTRGARWVVRSATTNNPEDLTRLRDARVALSEAQMGGGDVDEAAGRVAELEAEVLTRRRALTAAGAAPVGSATPGWPSAASGVPERTVPRPDDLPAGTSYVTYVMIDDSIIGLRCDRDGVQLTDHGPLSNLASSVRAQRSALRRLADERRTDLDRELRRLTDAGGRLDRLLVGPLDLEPEHRVVLALPGHLRNVVWNALPGLVGRSVVLAPTLGRWLDGADPISVGTIGAIGGPGLSATAEELASIGPAWGLPGMVEEAAGCATAIDAFGSCDLVHIAAHGTFRSDNPFFSSVDFVDGPLTVLELSDLGRLPSLVVLAACDAAASARAGAVEDIAVSTATELQLLGVRATVAPVVAVNDRASSTYSLCLHENLTSDLAVDEAIRRTRALMLDHDDPRTRAAAYAFHLFADAGAAQPVQRSG